MVAKVVCLVGAFALVGCGTEKDGDCSSSAAGTSGHAQVALLSEGLEPSKEGGECNVPGGAEQVGGAVSSKNRGNERATDGAEGNTVECIVQAGGCFSAKLRRGDPSNLTFSVDGSGSSASVSMWTARTQTSLTDSDCTIDVHDDEDGAIWASFDCAQMKANGVSCALKGTFVFEDCASP